MAVPIQSQISNPITGVFGIGQMQMFTANGTWTVPPGVAKVRVRMWGAGANYCSNSSHYGGGGGGGFALKTIYDLTGVTSVAVVVGAGIPQTSTASTAGVRAGTSSFGSYCSATGGLCGVSSDANSGGTGVGGDINNTGGKGGYSAGTANGGGGGSASLIGNGAGATASTPNPSNGGAGAGFGSSTGNQPTSGGFMTTGGVCSNSTSFFSTPPTASIQPFSIDFIGTGGGGGTLQFGVNGGGGGFSAGGGFPAGGTGYGGPTALSAGGLVIVEW